MHEVLEIVMPQVDDIEKAVSQIMEPFNENGDYEERICGGFWDFYIIGGRWAGHKLTAGLDKDALKAFYDDLKIKEVTVSGLQCGKQEISPASQIPLVDELWTSYFPEYAGRACPLFNHSNNQYENDCLYGDVLRIKDVPDGVSCSRFIVANYDYDGDKLEAKTMFSDSIWNGVNHEKTDWDGMLRTALSKHINETSNYSQEYKDENTPDDDWIVVTVDYHS